MDLFQLPTAVITRPMVPSDAVASAHAAVLVDEGASSMLVRGPQAITVPLSPTVMISDLITGVTVPGRLLGFWRTA